MRTIKATIAAALCGAAFSAAGQGVTIFFSVEGTDVGVGDTLHWTVSAETTGLSSTGYFGGFVGSFLALNGDAYTAMNITPLMEGVGTTPTGNHGTIDDVNLFHSALIATDNPTNPLTIMTFDIVVGANARGRPLEYSAPGMATLFASDFVFEAPIELTDISVVSDRFLLVPGHSGIAIAIGGFLATGRRRRGGRF